MPTAVAHVTTPRAARFLVQFCRHAEAMSGSARDLHGGGRPRPDVLDVRCSGTDGSVTFTWGSCLLSATTEALTVRLECTTDDQLRAMQELLTADLERFGRRERLTVSWQRAEVPAAEPVRAPANPPTARTSGLGRRGRAVLLAAAVALVVATHVLLGGAVLRRWRWISVTADAVLVLVVLKIVGAVLLTVRGRASHLARSHAAERGRSW